MRPTNVAYVCPSVTTFGFVNPGYRIYTIDGQHPDSTFAVLDHETYYMNLTQANLDRDSKPIEYLWSYSAQKAFQMNDLTPAEWHKLVLNMKKDDSIFQKFYKFFFNRSSYLPNIACYGRTCKYNILCRLITAKSRDFTFCKKFLSKFNFSIL